MFEELKPRKQPMPTNKFKYYNSSKSLNRSFNDRSCSMSSQKSKNKYKLNNSSLSKKSLLGKNDKSNISKNSPCAKYNTPYNKESRL